VKVGRIPLLAVLVGVLSFGLIGAGGALAFHEGDHELGGGGGVTGPDESQGPPNIFSPGCPGARCDPGTIDTPSGCDPSGQTPQKCRPPTVDGPDGDGPDGFVPDGPGPDVDGPGPGPDGVPPDGELGEEEEFDDEVAQDGEVVTVPAPTPEGAVLAAEEVAAAEEAPAELAVTGLELWQLALASGLIILSGFGLRRVVADRA
jgi:hypothetical protein